MSVQTIVQPIEVQKRALPRPGHPDIAKSLGKIAGIYQSCGNYDKALELLNTSLEMLQKALPPGHTQIATTIDSIARVTDQIRFKKLERGTWMNGWIIVPSAAVIFVVIAIILVTTMRQKSSR